MSKNRPNTGMKSRCTTRAFQDCQEMAAIEEPPKSIKLLEDELRRLQQRTQIGQEVWLEWLPGITRYEDGKRLAEEVKGNTIIIYADNTQEGKELVRHGFSEWMLNQNTKPYRQLINKLISLFEDLQYERKESIVEALTRLL